MTFKVSTATGTAIGCSASSLATAGLLVDITSSHQAASTSIHQAHIKHSSKQPDVCLIRALQMLDELCHCNLWTWTGLTSARQAGSLNQLEPTSSCKQHILYPVYTIKQTSSNQRANIQQMHLKYTCTTCALIDQCLLYVCLMFASCMLCFMHASY